VPGRRHGPTFRAGRGRQCTVEHHGSSD
jgi:hypothetical protein